MHDVSTPKREAYLADRQQWRPYHREKQLRHDGRRAGGRNVASAGPPKRDRLFDRRVILLTPSRPGLRSRWRPAAASSASVSMYRGGVRACCITWRFESSPLLYFIDSSFRWLAGIALPALGSFAPEANEVRSVRERSLQLTLCEHVPLLGNLRVVRRPPGQLFDPRQAAVVDGA